MKVFFFVPPVAATRFYLISLLVIGLILLGVTSAAIASGLQQNRYKSTADPDMKDVGLRSRHNLNHIYHFDLKPLGSRTPVILLPGRAEEFQDIAWWKKFHKMARRDKDFNQHYKLYIFVYDSKQQLEAQSLDFSREFKAYFSRVSPDQRPILITYSLGGVIARDAMRDPDVYNLVSTVFGIAVPYHGSPMFDPDWFARYLHHPLHSPIRTAWDRLIYRAYMFNKTNLTDGLKWDNFDRSMPQFDGAHLKILGDHVTDDIPAYHENMSVPGFKKKLIVYASYLENGYTHSNQPFNPIRLPKYVFDTTASLPREAIESVLPFYGFTVHSVFTYMNNQMANLPTFTPTQPKGKNTNLYRFNDGAIPLSSTLYLPARNEPYNDNFQGLIKARDVAGIRVFVNLDHMHVGQYSMFGSRLRGTDVLHPKDGIRTPNEWLLYDLKRLHETPDASPAAL